MLRWSLLSLLAFGCTPSEERVLLDAAVLDAAAPDAMVPDEPLVEIPEGAPALCHRPGSDRVRDVFCAANPPVVDSLRSLQAAIKFGPGAYVRGSTSGTTTNAVQGSYVGILLGHSTALSGQEISSINPRAIILGNQAAMAFQRGTQAVEVAAPERKRGGFNLYLFTFEQACNASGCTPTDLYSPRIESNWQNVTVRDEDDLKNTPQDCRQCHQRGSDRPTLLMRELRAPWTHFFDPDRSGISPGVRGVDLLDDFIAAHGDEEYGSLGYVDMNSTVGFDLEQIMVKPQPLLFDAPGIENERFPYRNGGFPSTPGPSPIWEAAYEAFKRGEQLALPYLEVRATDPSKLAAKIEAYRRFRSQGEPLPELSDVFSDDPLTRARIGLSTEPGATGPQILVQACGSCHNDVLDQTVSRARFNIGRLERTARDKALDRIQRSDLAAMPPKEFRQLTPEARAVLSEFLRSDADDPLLHSAAKLGMAGGGGQ